MTSIIKLKAGETVLVAATDPDLGIGGGPIIPPDLGLGIPTSDHTTARSSPTASD
jgi:hypothetical protein